MMRSVCAVIVTYNPTSCLLDNMKSLALQVNSIVVVDNGSGIEAGQHLFACAAFPQCTVIRNSHNMGIAAALNQGVQCATQNGADCVVTFDQDSRITVAFISHLLAAYSGAAEPAKVGAIASCYVDAESGVKARLMRNHRGEILTTMSSGTMIPTRIFREVGVFNESLFMDYVDIEFCLRLRKAGLHIVESSAVLQHSLGRTTYHRVLGLRFGATNHSAARRYYITRNRLRLLATYRQQWEWVWREVRGMCFEVCKILLAEKDKLAKGRAMVKGAYDAMRGNTGKQVDL